MQGTVQHLAVQSDPRPFSTGDSKHHDQAAAKRQARKAVRQAIRQIKKVPDYTNVISQTTSVFIDREGNGRIRVVQAVRGSRPPLEMVANFMRGDVPVSRI